MDPVSEFAKRGRKMDGMERDDAEIEEGIRSLCAKGEKVEVSAYEVPAVARPLFGLLDVKPLDDEVMGEKVGH